MSNEQAKLNALKEALKQSMNLYRSGKSWGNMVLNSEQEERENQSRKMAQAASEKAAHNKGAREKANKKAMENAKRAKIIANHTTKFMTPSGLKQIAKECKWHCEGKTCFAHKSGVCPYIHKGGPGSSKATGITLKNSNSKKKSSGRGGGTRKSRRS